MFQRMKKLWKKEREKRKSQEEEKNWKQEREREKQKEKKMVMVKGMVKGRQLEAVQDKDQRKWR